MTLKKYILFSGKNESNVRIELNVAIRYGPFDPVLLC